MLQNPLMGSVQSFPVVFPFLQLADRPFFHSLPRFYTRLLKNWVSLKRIEDYLNEEEVPTFVSSLKTSSKPVPADSTEGKIGFIDASFQWNAGNKDKDASKDKDKKKADVKPSTEALLVVVEEEPVEARVFELNNISFVFPPGLTIVTGATGSGKTALLMSLLGELNIIKGNVLLPKDLSHVNQDGLTNSCSYSSQTAWLQNLTIKENM